MAISRTIFREYDIRGVAGKDLTEEVATAIAGAFAGFLAEKGVKGTLRWAAITGPLVSNYTPRWLPASWRAALMSSISVLSQRLSRTGRNTIWTSLAESR